MFDMSSWSRLETMCDDFSILECFDYVILIKPWLFKCKGYWFDIWDSLCWWYDMELIWYYFIVSLEYMIRDALGNMVLCIPCECFESNIMIIYIWNDRYTLRLPEIYLWIFMKFMCALYFIRATNNLDWIVMNLTHTDDGVYDGVNYANEGRDLSIRVCVPMKYIVII